MIKFKRGAGAILALIILFVVLVSVVGVVFVAMNGQSLRPNASSAPGPQPINAPEELACSGEWRTVKDLGKSRPGAIAGYNNRLIIVDYQPFPQGSAKQYLRAREINLDGPHDTDWYSDVVGDSQASFVLKQEGGDLNLYAYSGVSANRIIVKTTYNGEKSWSGAAEVPFVSMGVTGPDTAFLNGKFYRIMDSLPDASLDPTLTDSKGYLQECIPDPADRACWYWPSPASIGGQNSNITTDGGLSGTVYLRGGNQNVSVGQAYGNGDTGSFVIPASVPPGNYTLAVGNNPGVVCKHPSGATNIEVKLAGTPPPVSYNKCDFNKDGSINNDDLRLLGQNYGSVDPSVVKIYDVNGDGKINSGDQGAVASKNPRYCN